MVSVSAAGFNAITSANTLSLFKPSEDDKTAAKVITPSVQASTADRLGAIADLAAKLIDIKSGKTGAPEIDQASEGDNTGLSMGEARKFYANIDQDTRDNLAEHVADFLGDAFKAALRNGTATVQRGEEVGMVSTYQRVIHGSDGYYTGMSASGGWDWAQQDQFVQWTDGVGYTTSDGKHASFGIANGVTFYVTWPKE